MAEVAKQKQKKTRVRLTTSERLCGPRDCFFVANLFVCREGQKPVRDRGNSCVSEIDAEIAVGKRSGAGGGCVGRLVAAVSKGT